jgi:glycosyltransferase involved in cell wall biosynthesis
VLPENPTPDRPGLGLPPEPFLFLCMADGLSFLERKNPLGAIRAYRRAFPQPGNRAGLVVKLINSRYDAGLRNAIYAAAREDPSIHLIDRYLSLPELHSLFASIDAFVSLHRAEGFGLPIAEAMAFGKPALATAWSGNLDFMTPWNSALIDYREVEIAEDIGPYARGQRWADPDLDHAAAMMARMVHEPAWAQTLGARAREDVRRRYAPAAAGRLLQDRLARILDRR